MLKKAIATGLVALVGLSGAARADDNPIDTIRSPMRCGTTPA